MIVSHLSVQELIIHIKHYNNLLINGCRNPENVTQFREDCVNELKRKRILYKEK